MFEFWLLRSLLLQLVAILVRGLGLRRAGMRFLGV